MVDVEVQAAEPAAPDEVGDGLVPGRAAADEVLEGADRRPLDRPVAVQHDRVRSTPSTWASRSSASSRGVSLPAAPMATAAESTASRAGTPRTAPASALEPAALLVGGQRVGEAVELPLEDRVEVVLR